MAQSTEGPREARGKGPDSAPESARIEGREPRPRRGRVGAQRAGSRLDPAEQVQAAKATEDAVRGEAVGSTANWTSETRQNVSGSSTVIARNDEAGGRRCINVTDFIIVDGEVEVIREDGRDTGASPGRVLRGGAA